MLVGLGFCMCFGFGFGFWVLGCGFGVWGCRLGWVCFLGDGVWVWFGVGCGFGLMFLGLLGVCGGLFVFFDG